MAALLNLSYQNLQRLDNKYKDPATDNLFLMGSPIKILTITALYCLFVKKIGPALMKDRPAFDLKYILLIYNFLQVVANLYLAYISTDHITGNKAFADWSCMHSDYGPELLRLCHLYYLLKVTDYLDTIFFVLRKRFHQISFLHFYHHILMVLGSFSIRYIPRGHQVMLGYVNTYVHTIMYFYYFISAFRPGLKKSIWWKKHVTQLQIFQFLLLTIHFIRPLLRNDCDQSRWLLLFCLLQNIIMAAMFINFYIKAYLRKPNTLTAKEK